MSLEATWSILLGGFGTMHCNAVWNKTCTVESSLDVGAVWKRKRNLGSVYVCLRALLPAYPYSRHYISVCVLTRGEVLRYTQCNAMPHRCTLFALICDKILDERQM